MTLPPTRTLSTGHAGLDAALGAAAYGPCDAAAVPNEPQRLAPLMVVLPPAASAELAVRVVRFFRDTLSAWGIDAHQWDARGTELQPVLDVWQPGRSVPPRWGADEATRILVVASADFSFGPGGLADLFPEDTNSDTHALLVFLDQAIPLVGFPEALPAPHSALGASQQQQQQQPPGRITSLAAREDGQWGVLPQACTAAVAVSTSAAAASPLTGRSFWPGHPSCSPARPSLASFVSGERPCLQAASMLSLSPPCGAAAAERLALASHHAAPSAMPWGTKRKRLSIPDRDRGDLPYLDASLSPSPPAQKRRTSTHATHRFSPLGVPPVPVFFTTGRKGSGLS